MIKVDYSGPKTPFALIRGSGTWGVDFPGEAEEEGVELLEDNLIFNTPYGETGKFQLIGIEGKYTVDGRDREVLVAVSHGWRPGVFNSAASVPVFWALREAGVKKIIVEVTAGSLDPFLQPRDLVIPADVFDLLQSGITLLPGRFEILCRGKQLLCPLLARTLEETAQGLGFPRIYGYHCGAVIGTTQGPRFETPAEARFLQQIGCHLVGQSIIPEANLARDIGACYAHADLIVDYVDGVLKDEQPWELDEIHFELKTAMAKLVLRTLKKMELTDVCGCMRYRMERPAEYLEGL